MGQKKSFEELVKKMAVMEDGQLGKLRGGFAAFASPQLLSDGTVTNTVTVSGNCSCSCTCEATSTTV
ncbi:MULTISPECIES: hypothetical protein [Pedobacter]|uniref:hypothetical protein n=1 Tax=Pedobacter TaxID=84567 RepID=UPI000706C7E7|nr:MULTISPECIES: hypothetical protein [Pedobacter]ALL05440.1 hypothetical protein AQ505_08015 [Pedobacter sp. PACM 27299]